MNTPLLFDLNDEAATIRLGEALALLLRPGDTLALTGPLGAGKTTLTRALLRAFSGNDGLDVPSPSFSLIQPYDGPGFRFPITHADFYRLDDAEEVEELGLDDYLSAGALIVEWPERGPERFLASAFRLDLAGLAPRRAVLSAASSAQALRLERLGALRRFLKRSGLRKARRRFLQGDASPRAYESIRLDGEPPLVLLNADAQPDRPVTSERKTYMAATHLAANEDIGPVVAIATELAHHGFSTPKIRAFSRDERAVLFEDFGKEYIVADGMPVAERYHAAIDVLLAMHAIDWPEQAEGPGGLTHDLPLYTRQALEIEAGLFLDKYLGGLKGIAPDAAQRVHFATAWSGPFDRFGQEKRGWTLVDFHSPNLHWLAERTGIARIGIIDTQDARLGPPAYDVVSLIQDARVTISNALQDELLGHYLDGRKQADPTFSGRDFLEIYAICGAQRATRILGVFARLAAQDGKPGYLKHIPRISAYLKRCLAASSLVAVRHWFEEYAPDALEERA